MIYGAEHTYSRKRTFLFYPLLRYNVLAKEDFCIMKVKDVEHRVRLDDFEHRMLIACVNMARSELIKQGKEGIFQTKSNRHTVSGAVWENR